MANPGYLVFSRICSDLRALPKTKSGFGTDRAKERMSETFSPCLPRANGIIFYFPLVTNVTIPNGDNLSGLLKKEENAARSFLSRVTLY